MSADEKRKLAAIMFTDMVGYSALSQRDEKLAQELLDEHRRLLREIFRRFNGTEIKPLVTRSWSNSGARWKQRNARLKSSEAAQCLQGRGLLSGRRRLALGSNCHAGFPSTGARSQGIS